MKFVRSLFWLVAALPIAAACYWASFAARLPEPWLDRAALGEVTPRWQFGEWADAAGEPLHVVARVLHLGALQIPGASIASVVWLNVLFALLLVVVLTGLFRGAFAASGAAGPAAFALFGLLVATPALGANWLHGERAAMFLVPLLFAAALYWLQGERRFAGRALAALLVAAVAPFCHVHGAIVFLALTPALIGAARRAGSRRGLAWVGALLVIGNLATIFSMRYAAGIGAEGANWFTAFTAAPLDGTLALLRTTGGVCFDVVPDIDYDELAIGAFCWLFPLLIWGLGDRTPTARGTAAPWWSCYLFGLLIVVVTALRYELMPPIGTAREAMLGAFLLPVGVFGVLAARFGTSLLAFGLGALAVLAVQDWYRGLEQLRLAHMRSEVVEGGFVIAEVTGAGPQDLPMRGPNERQLLQQHGWIPSEYQLEAPPVAAFTGPITADRGVMKGGSATAVDGELRSSLRGDTVQWIGIVSKVGDAEPKVVASLRPEFRRVGRQLSWQIEFAEPLPEGATVRAVGLLVRPRRCMALGPTFVVKDGILVATNGT